MTIKARTITLTAKGRQAVREMRLHDAVPVIPDHGWPPEPKAPVAPPKAKTVKAKPEEPRQLRDSGREQAISEARGRDLFLSPAFVLPGDRLLYIVAGERRCLGTVSHVERIGVSYRLHLNQGGYKTCGPTSAVLVAPRGE